MHKRDRIRIKKQLPHGAIKEIALKVEKDPSLVSRILEGTREDHHGVFQIAETICKEAIERKKRKKETIQNIAKSIKKFSS
jgi:predicted transcriptional regulator with HTH domain